MNNFLSHTTLILSSVVNEFDKDKESKSRIFFSKGGAGWGVEKGMLVKLWTQGKGRCWQGSGSNYFHM